MNEIVLFSPIGGTDPISEYNLHEGAMLHICRHYGVTKVYMYMSGEILEKHKKDNRYVKAVEKLAERQNRKIDCKVIERPDLKEVQNFDFFYEEYQKILKDIISELDETDRFLLNVSSGTPAMKSAVLIMHTLGEFNSTAIQVKTPEKGMNNHTHNDEYDVDTYWGLCAENEIEDDGVGRCVEVNLPSLIKIRYSEIIKNHVKKCNYAAALDVLENAKTLFSGNQYEEYHALLEMANMRLHLDYNHAKKIATEKGLECFSIVDGSKIKIFEYALAIDVKRMNENYADFIRALTPLFLNLMELMLEKQCNIKISKYYTDDNVKWDMEKLVNTEVFNILINKWENFGNKNSTPYVQSVHILEVIINLSDVSLKVKECAKKLRKIEESIRNLAAHNIVSITDEDIKKKTDMSSKQIMDLIKEAFTYTAINVKTHAWNDYSRMNESIIGKIDLL